MSEHDEQAKQDEADVEGHKRMAAVSDESQDPKAGQDEDTPDVEGHLKKGHKRFKRF